MTIKYSCGKVSNIKMTIRRNLRHARLLKTIIGGDVEGRIGRPWAEYKTQIMENMNKKKMTWF